MTASPLAGGRCGTLDPHVRVTRIAGEAPTSRLKTRLSGNELMEGPVMAMVILHVDESLTDPDLVRLRGAQVRIILAEGGRGAQGSAFIAWLAHIVRVAAQVTLEGADLRLRTLLRLVGLDRRIALP